MTALTFAQEAGRLLAQQVDGTVAGFVRPSPHHTRGFEAYMKGDTDEDGFIWVKFDRTAAATKRALVAAWGERFGHED